MKSSPWLRAVAAVLLGVIGIGVVSYADAAQPLAIEGRVVGIIDGDTIDVLESRGIVLRERRVRLAGIDAPEKAQDFGNRARQHLASLCAGKAAHVDVVNIDRYGRAVGYVTCEGVPANLEMVKRGLAWAYTQYSPPREFIEAQNAAQAARLGLWSDPRAIAPWQWRKTQRP